MTPDADPRRRQVYISGLDLSVASETTGQLLAPERSRGNAHTQGGPDRVRDRGGERSGSAVVKRLCETLPSSGKTHHRP